MTEPSTSPALPTVRELLAEHRTRFIVLGILLIVLGIVAIGFPLMTTIAAKIFLGWLFLIGGAVQLYHAYSTKNWSAFFLNALLGVLYVLAGAWLAFFPLTGIVTLTVLLALMFILEGVLQASMAFHLRPQQGWGWMLTAAVVAVLVGVLILAQLPSSATWAIGLLVGINMISSGWAFVFLAMAAGKQA